MEGFKEGQAKEHKEKKVCDCGREAVEKVAGPRSENRGLRYLCCDHFVFFGKKKNYCRFFEWVDEPRITKEEKREVQALKRQRKGATSVNTAVLQSALSTHRVGKELDNQCETIEGLQVNKENLELEVRESENDPPQTQIHKEAADAHIDSTNPARDSLAADFRNIFVENVSASLCRAPTVAEQIRANNSLDSEHQENSLTDAVEPETGRSKFTGTMQHNRAVVQDVQGLNINVDVTAVGGDTIVTQIGPNGNFNTVLRDKALTTGYDSKESVVGVYETLETPSCLCLRAAVLKTVKSKGPNKGLRFWVCSNSRPFYVKKKKSDANGGEESCKFFRWVDEPCITKEENREAQALKRQGKGAASESTALLQPALSTRRVVKDLDNQCKTIEGLQVNKVNSELERREYENDPPPTQIHKDAVDALIDRPIPAGDSLAADSDNNSLDAEHQENSLTDAVEPETGRSKFTGTMQHNRAHVQNVQGFNLNVDVTAVGGDTSATQIGPNGNLNTVLRDKASTTGYDSKESVGGAYETLETPSCLCLRAAVLKSVKSKGPNKGLRFWVCSNSRPFYVKKKESNANGGEESCKFFRWVDTPFKKSDRQKDEEVQKRKEAQKKKELALLS